MANSTQYSTRVIDSNGTIDGGHLVTSDRNKAIAFLESWRECDLERGDIRTYVLETHLVTEQVIGVTCPTPLR
jgi:hypothetical protein